MKLICKVYNAFCAWHGTKDSSILLKALCRAYEEVKNLADDGTWQVDNHHAISSKETLLFTQAASPTKDMHL